MKSPTPLTLGQALELIDSGQRFSIRFWTADKRRGTGGQLRTIVRSVKSGLIYGEKANVTTSAPDKGRMTKNPNHYPNRTKNIVDMDNKGRVIKVHVALIYQINEHPVL